MSEQAQTPEEARQARIKRSIGVVLIGTVALVIFYYLLGGVTDVLMADAYTETPAAQ